MPLATVQKIDKLTPIENADNIETAQVLGWQVVVRKEEFKEGDLCIYIEIDSLIPYKDWSAFLFKTGSSDIDKINDDYQLAVKPYRLRTIKLRGQLSQGLVIPTSIIIDIHKENSEEKFKINCEKDCLILDYSDDIYYYDIGEDVTEMLEIEKYEKPLPNFGRGNIQAKGYFPNFIPKTDEVRIQAEPQLLEKLKGKPYYITTEVDGTSATFYKYKGKFGVCSRNLELKNPYKTYEGFIKFISREFRKLIGRTKKDVPPTNIYWQMVNKYKIDKWLPEDYAIQGEICGPGIQKNPLELRECELFIFNLFNINKYTYENPYHLLELSEGFCLSKLQFVPLEISSEGTKYEFDWTLEQLLEMAKGKYLNTNHNKEGIVVRSTDQTVSFKVVNNDYLLKDEE